jgi:hypothetical protein
MISMTIIWDETLAFLKRELHLLMPLWLGLFVVGDACMSLASDAIETAAHKANPAAVIGLILGGAIATVAQLSATAMVLRGGISIGEALRLGVKRLPKLILIGLCFVAISMAAILPLGLGLLAWGFDVTAVPMNLPPAAQLYVLAFSVIGVWLGARLVTLTPMIVDVDPPIFQSIRGSFQQTKGAAVLIVGVMLLYLVVASVVGLVVKFVVGGFLVYIGTAAGVLGLAHVLSALVSGAFSSALTLIATIFIAHLYRSLAKPG